MGGLPPSVRIMRFGVFEVDLHSAELRKRGIRLNLQSQPFLLLVTLLKSQGNLVTREELCSTLWPDGTSVDFDHSLGTAVNKLREVLGDSASSPRFIETLPRRGYRFIAPVEVVDETPPTPVVTEPAGRGPQRLSRRPLIWTISGLALALALLVALVTGRRHAPPAPPIRSLAVLPLENLSRDPSQDYFSDGMTDELITELGQLSALRVISRTSAMTYKGSHESLPQIARDLKVDAVVEGAVLRSGSHVRISAQLILGSTDRQLWASSYEGDLRDTFALQKKVASSIAEEVRVKLTSHEEAVLKNVSSVDQEAYDSYLKGRYFWNKRTPEGLKSAIDYFTRAAAKDPNYALAYAGLADSYALAGDWKYGVLSPKEAYPKAKAAATKALVLDNSLGEAHTSLAFCLDNFDWDFDVAGMEFARGIELSPGYATGHDWYGWHLAMLGRNSDAVREVEKAVSLDPLSLIVGADLAEELLIAHRYDEAIVQSRKTVSLDPFFGPAHFALGEGFAERRMFNDGITEFRKAVDLSPSSTAFVANLAHAFALSGMQEEAKKILADLTTRPGGSSGPETALVYLGLGEKDQAMAWLEKAYTEHFSPWVLMRPAFDPLRSEPRFQALLHRIGLK
jgi:TolB-like protein/DNA-binding winged helix-turn-helix (wHTH) protein